MNALILDIPFSSSELLVRLPEKSFLQLKKVVENVFLVKFKDGEKKCHCEVCSDGKPSFSFGEGEEGRKVTLKVVPL